MSNLIDKDALVAEIERLKDKAIDSGDRVKWYLYNDVIKAINTLEVKEVDRKVLCEDCDEDCEYAKKVEPSEIDFEQELYKAFGQVKDFTLGMRIAKRFYDMGYHQAEKDLELTWEDVRRIYLIVNSTINDVGMDNLTDKSIYQEVLKRFNKERR